MENKDKDIAYGPDDYLLETPNGEEYIVKRSSQKYDEQKT